MYSTSEDGNNDMFEVSLSRLRCSMNTMVEHEKLKGWLQIIRQKYRKIFFLINYPTHNRGPKEFPRNLNKRKPKKS